MRVIFAIFLAVLLCSGKAERTRRREQAELFDEVVRHLTCSASRVVLDIPKNTCPNIQGLVPHADVALFYKYINVCDQECIVKPKNTHNVRTMQFYYSLITICLVICTYSVLLKPLFVFSVELYK
jgi:hypothetical protein